MSNLAATGVNKILVEKYGYEWVNGKAWAPGTAPEPEISTIDVTPGPLPDWITPPPADAFVTEALETLSNPVTGEKFTVPTGGYTVKVSAPTPIENTSPTPSLPVATPEPVVTPNEPTGINKILVEKYGYEWVNGKAWEPGKAPEVDLPVSLPTPEPAPKPVLNPGQSLVPELVPHPPFHPPQHPSSHPHPPFHPPQHLSPEQAQPIPEPAPASEPSHPEPTDVNKILVEKYGYEWVNGKAWSPGTAPATKHEITVTPDQTVEETSSANDFPEPEQIKWFAEVSSSNLNPEYDDPFLNVTWTSENITVESNGIPTFEFIKTTPANLATQNHVWSIPIIPHPKATSEQVPLLGTVGFTTTGLPIFGPNEGAFPHPYGDPTVNDILDYCHGHTARAGDYHFHSAPECLIEHPDGTEEHYNIIGFALDGYPIVAHYSSVLDGAGEPILKDGETQFNWLETSGYEPNKDYAENVILGDEISTYAWANYKYNPSLTGVTLDNGNGRELAAENLLSLESGEYISEKDFIGFDYAYFLTESFPYFIARYRGEDTIKPSNSIAYGAEIETVPSLVMGSVFAEPEPVGVNKILVEKYGYSWVEGQYYSKGTAPEVNLEGNAIHTVTVSKVGNQNVFFIDGNSNPDFVVEAGKTYRFDQSDVSNANHPLNFLSEAGSDITSYVEVSGTAGSEGAYVELYFDTNDISNIDGPELSYFCEIHGAAMGNDIEVTNIIA